MAKARETAKLVPMRELADHVQKAVDLAAKSAGLAPGPAGLIARWDLYGRIVRDFAEGQKFAAETKKSLGTSIGGVSPAVLMIDKRIIAGFFPVKEIGQLREL